MSRRFAVPETAFTHSPPAHANFWLGALQLFAWLLFHPSAWRSALQQAAPDLRPDFILLDLSLRHWQQRPCAFFLGQKMIQVGVEAEGGVGHVSILPSHFAH